MLRVMNLYCEGDESRNGVQLLHTFCKNILTITSLCAALQITIVHCDLNDVFSATCLNFM